LNPNIDRGDTDMEDDLGCDTRKEKTLPRAHKNQRAPTRIEDIKNFDRKGEQNQHQSEGGNKTSEQIRPGSDNANNYNIFEKIGQVKEDKTGNQTSLVSTNPEIVNNNNPETEKENVVDSIANSSKPVSSDSTLGPFVACINNFKKNNSSESMEAGSETSSDCVTQETDIDDFCRSQGRLTFLTVQSPHLVFHFLFMLLLCNFVFL